MFAKSYKLKSNNTLKNSEKKHLQQRILQEFSGATQDNVKELLPVKSNTSCMKIILHSGDTVGVYVVDGIPIVYEDDKGLVPTVCALWKVQDLVPTLIIYSQVLSKLACGVPLYIPGVIRGAGGGGWAEFSRGQPIATSTQDNKAAGATGRATLSSRELVHLVTGVCWETIQVYGDQLCKDSKFLKINRPKLGPASYPNDVVDELTADLNQISIQLQPVREEWPTLGKPAPNEPRVIPDQPAYPQPSAESPTDSPTLDDESVIEDNSESAEVVETEQTMEELFRSCLLSLIKLQGSKLPFPLLASLLYKNYLMPMCPADQTLDVKKSSYKKLGKFLEAMQEEGLIEVRDVEKGVSAVIGVNVSHPAVKSHSVPEEVRSRSKEVAEPPPAEYTPPIVREVFCITAAVLPLFSEYKKGTAVSASDIRSAVTQYVRTRSLVTSSPSTIALDPTLAQLLGKPDKDVVKWDEVMNAVTSRMTAATEMRFADGSIQLTKSKLQPITMQLATRSGNKKVTLVSNLEAYGFNLSALAAAWQHAAAAACAVTRTPSARCDQLLLQGDQTRFVARILIEKYGLPKKYVEGADKALKKKK
ncbi:hypothetical protein ACJJTC_006453 [Scirpophaga incertulas]